jgi:S-adenosylhomocysteine hydrolase
MSTTTAAQVNCDVKNMELADLGKKRIDWANQSMNVLQIIRKEFIKKQPLKGVRIAACLHVTAETANLAICLRDGGADVVLCASNPLSTQDDVAASLVRDYGVSVFAIKGEDNDTYYSHILAAIDHRPNITMDDGADLVSILHTKRTDALEGVIGAGAQVIVTEVDPTKALEAVMDGFRVMSMAEAAKIGDVFCTVTGNKNVLAKEHFDVMKNNAIISNSGHFNVEIDIPALEKMSSSKRTTRNFVEEYTLKDGRKINLLGDGRLINLAAAEGHPASVMDMSFADQALSVEYMVKNAKTLEKTVYKVPDELDKRVAKLKLESMAIKIDRLTPEQEEYLAGWSEGT